VRPILQQLAAIWCCQVRSRPVARLDVTKPRNKEESAQCAPAAMDYRARRNATGELMLGGSLV
jgi:hypothetical protein